MRIDLSAINLGATGGFAERLAANALSAGDRVAVECDGSELTWGELYARVCRVANGLADLGCRPGDRVAILATNSTAYFECFLGIVGAGLSAVTLPTMVKREALAAMFEDSGARVLFACADNAELAAHGGGRAASLVDGGRIAYDFAAPGWTGYDAWLEAASESPPRTEVAPEAEFNIVYSSGTTGRPKGIVHSHATRASMAAGFAALGFDGDAATLIATPLYTNMSIPAFLATVWGGGRSLVMRKFDPEAYLALAEKRGASHFFMVPTMVQRLLEAPAFEATDLGATRLKYVAGSLLRPEHKRALMARWPGPLIEVYGMTEGAPATCLFADRYPDKLASVGQPAAGCEVRVIDDRGREVAAGIEGEIVGRSGSMMVGYNNLPEATEEIVWRDPEGGVFFRSGDIGRFDEDGFLYVLDRMKDMIISGGLNIYAADVEAVVAGHHSVAEVAVIAVPSERWGESPLALVVPRPATDAGADDILAWCNGRLAKYHRLAGVELREQLPRNALGKVLKRELRAPYWRSTDQR